MKIIYTFIPTILSREWIRPDFQEIFLRKSIEDIKQHYSDIDFYTNDAFAKRIKDIKGLNIIIQESRPFNKELWSLPKIFTFEAQRSPFLSLDLDVILGHKPEFNSILVESIENGDLFKQTYRQADAKYTHAYNMGVYGCKDLDLNASFCDKAYRFIDENYENFKNKGILRFMPIYFEQLMLAETLEEFNIAPTLIDNSNYIHLKSKKRDLDTYKKYKL